MGRIVPEKAPHLAVAAARIAGRPLQLVGPIHDQGYFDREIRPLLDDEVVYLGHLAVDDLAQVVGGAAVAIVTPAWDEPYGLVVAEALAAGTPVAAFARGGIPEILDASCGVLAPPDDVAALAIAVERAALLSRDDCQRRARSACSVATMAARYTEAYRDVLAPGGALPVTDR
jgi:glycosyltransferase involved in cell wall biosynthesis